MNERIRKLREQSLDAETRISAERAVLLTEFYRGDMARRVSVPVGRAMAFKYILENKTIYINPGELIVGERGPGPKAVPTYPEICLHSLEDMQTLNDRPKVSFKSDHGTMKTYLDEIIPFWKGKTQRDRIFANMDKAWLDAYQAGVFTEFQEQRAPGHTVLGDKIYRTGMLDIIEEIRAARTSLDFFNDPGALDKREELKAMEIAADALIGYAERYAEEMQRAAASADDGEKAWLEELAAICKRVPAHAPQTFHEALQYYWFVHVGVITELNPWDSFNPGRLDQHLFPFYKKETEAGALTRERACELLQSFWIKFNNHPAPPKIGVTAKESSTYTDFALINVGGLTPGGEDAVNELSYLILDVVEEMRMVQPSSMIQLSRKNPDSFITRAAHIVKTGFGQPSIFNTDAIVEELTRQGKSPEDARNGGASGCVEAGAFGTEAYWLTGYFNLAKVLEITLHNGTDPVTGRKIGLETGNPVVFETFEDLMNAYLLQLKHFIDIKIKGNVIIEKLFMDHMPAPFLSILIDDCIASGKDYNAGGARYNTSYIQGVGLGSLTDMLTAIKHFVFDGELNTENVGAGRNKRFGELLEAMGANFDGYDDLRYRLIYETPKYGNDDDYADEQARRVFEMFFEAVDGRPTPRGGVFRINMLPTTSHVYFGSVIGATPDGRKARQPLSEGISPFQGADTKGPTAVLKSAAKIDHLKTGGTLLNQKFTPQLLQDGKGIESLVHLVRSYFRMNGHHIQFNVVTAGTLRDAKRHPEKYRDLIVRVAGYSDYFNDLTEELQDEIIRRTEHEQF